MKVRFLAVVAALLATVTVHADTLVLNTGRRIQGQLVGVADNQIEFEEQVGTRRRVLVIARQDVARIEFGDGPALGLPAAPVTPIAPVAPALTIPRGMRERVVDVQSKVRWNDTGVDVRDGQQIYFQASGEWRMGGRRRLGAAGEAGSPNDAGRPIPDRPGAALVARIGDGQDVFFVGGEVGPFRARQSGRLFLGINDSYLDDNNGSIQVRISY
jgi:hypothetical protein